MNVELGIEDFLGRARSTPVLDVRTPAEFSAGHIPGAVNVPLFSNDERAEIGTIYKHEGREPAVRTGLDRVAPKLTELADRMSGLAADGRLLIHCWRGGMRSGSMAWLAGTLGVRTSTLKGGYKSFRRWVLASLETRRPVRVLSGLTGAGKTEILRVLAGMGEPVIDLEGLANHKGSAFGDLGEEPQPTQEHFENELAVQWTALDAERPVWMENESRMVGRRVIPEGVWQSKLEGHFAVVEIPEELRVGNLRAVYENHPTEAVVLRIEAVRKRLGGARTDQAVEAFLRGDADEACRHLLHYYDRTYWKAIDATPAGQVSTHRFRHSDPHAIAEELRRVFS